MEIGSLLDKDETAVFKACYDNSLKKESKIIDIREATRNIVEGGLSTEQIQDCIEIILKRHLGDEHIGKSGTGRIFTIRATTYGFTLYANAFMPDIDRLYANVLDSIVHQGLKTHKEVAAHLDQSKFLIAYIFDLLQDQGRIQAVRSMGDSDYTVLLITAEGRKAAGKRALEKQNEPPLMKDMEDSLNNIDVSGKADKRNRVLLRVYLESNGNPSVSVSDDVVVEKETVTHEELIQEIQPYLQARRLIKFQGFKATAIDEAGIDKVEKELLAEAKSPVAPKATSERVDFSFIADNRIRTIVERDYAELQKLEPEIATKSVLVLCGSIIEGLLLDAIVTDGYWTYAAASERFLKDMIHPAKTSGIIQHDNLSEVLRVFRNLIHPAREIRENLSFDFSHANHARAAVEVIISEVKKWYANRRL